MNNNISSINYIIRDILPAELPLIFSNKKLYDFLLSNSSYLESSTPYKTLNCMRTIPVNFNIKKGEFGIRKLSLAHPYMQILVTKFIHDYAPLIILFFQQNKLFSLRSPISINEKEKIIAEKYLNEINEMLNIDNENRNDELNKFITNYFNLSHFPKLTDFYSSYYLKDLELKFSYLTRIDIQNCFESIYTHSVDWAYLGKKEIAKGNTRNVERFSFIMDSIMQNMNYGETNGILIGPEFSRLFAEIILTRLDKMIFEQLVQKGLNYKNDYEIVRFIDDIYIFTNSIEDAIIIEKEIELIFSDYRLHINHEKRRQELRPFLRDHLWSVPVKNSLNKFSEFLKNMEDKKKGYGYNSFYSEIRGIIVEYEAHKRYIISYLMSSLENMTSNFIKAIETFDADIQYFHISKYIDILAQIINHSINYDNISKYSRIILKFHNFLSGTFLFDLDEIIYKKSYLMLNYNKDRLTEMLNLIIALSYIKGKLLPPSLLNEYLDNDKNYLVLSTIAFYISNTDPNKLYYTSVFEKINVIINDILTECSDIFGIDYTSNRGPESMDPFLQSDLLYIIHDFYTYPQLSLSNKKKIRKIKSFIHPLQPADKNDVKRVFIQYIKDFDKPFMRWDASYEEIISDFILEKQIKQIVYS